MSSKLFFVTGTDTGVGKTLVSSALLFAARAQGLKTLGLKPIAAGCEHHSDGWRNGDAIALQKQTSAAVAYTDINPFAFRAAIAPHIAAKQENSSLNAESIVRHCKHTLAKADADFVIIEGAGGWYVPLSERETLADVAQAIAAPVIMVVAIKLGCINHALLTAAAIRQNGLTIAGWVANCLDSTTLMVEENINTLKEMLHAPCVGEIPTLSNTDDVAQVATFLNLNTLL